MGNKKIEVIIIVLVVVFAARFGVIFIIWYFIIKIKYKKEEIK